MNNKATIISFAYCVFNISFVSIEINFSARNKNRFFCIGTNNIPNAIENAERNSLFKPGFCHALFEEEDFEEEEFFLTLLLVVFLLVVATIFFNTLCAVNNKEAIRSREEERKRV
tara:strand:- start:1101 stop:1445 length:345 start_codon:yes stop_codon:yes gene_type:complete